MYTTDSQTSPPPLPKAGPDRVATPSDNTSEKSSIKSRNKVRERDTAAGSSKELTRLLLFEEARTKELEEALCSVTERLKNERRRGDDAEQKVLEATTRFKDANDARVVALQDCLRAREELELYKVALDNAQKEIFRAQSVLDAVEGKRREAEEEAAKARSRVRKMTEEKVVSMAREEGRKQGIQEGLAMGKDIGYVHGRSRGFEQGRSGTERNDPEETNVEQPIDNVTPENQDRDARRYHDSPEYSGLPPPMASSAEEIRPVPVQNSAASRRSSVTDGWIPETDQTLHIRVPAAYEFSRPPPTPETRSPGLSLTSPPPATIPADVLMVPPPGSQREPINDGSTPRRPPRRRRSSNDSITSCRTSELEILSAPDYVPGTRGTVLSVIPEALSSQGTPSGMANGSIVTEPEEHTPSPIRVSMPAPAPPQAAPSARILADSVRQNIYLVPRSPSDSLGSNGQSGKTTPEHRTSVTSSNGSVLITVVPPSRPASNISQETTIHASFLSPSDANRPIPLPPTSEEENATPAMVPLPPTGSTMPMSLPDGGFPLGFIPTGPPLSVSPYSRGGETGYTAAGVPLPPSTIGSRHHRLPSNASYAGSSTLMPGGFNDTYTPRRGGTPVIPTPSAKYTTGRHNDDSGSSTSTDTLTTPPGRRINLAKSPSDPYYHAGSVRSGTSRYTAGGVPLLPSTVAGTPRTAYTNTPGPETRHLYAGATPGNLRRSMSISTDRNASVRG